MSSNKKSLLENKVVTLDLIDLNIQKSSNLGTIGTTSDMAKAILRITSHLRKFQGARIGRLWKNSDVNLSYILSRELMPIFDKIIIPHSSTAISVSLKPNLNENSTTTDIYHAMDKIKAFCSVVNITDKDALDLLYESLIDLNSAFSPDIKSIKRSGDGYYCKFCHRESRPKFDSCDRHKGTNRVDGKKQLDRYLKLKKLLIKTKSYERNDKFILNYLNKLGISSWKTNEDATVWIETLFKKMCLHSGNDKELKKLSQDIASFSKEHFSPDHYSWNWPMQLSGTFLRYEAYELSELKPPKKDLSNGTLEILYQLWDGKHINDISFPNKDPKAKLKIKRRNKIWSDKISDLRNLGISDSVIKVALDLKYLPN
jgi:hypothetical protein